MKTLKAKEDTYLQRNTKIISAKNLKFLVNQDILKDWK